MQSIYNLAILLGLDKINYASINFGIIGGFSNTSIIGNNRGPNWHNLGCSVHYFYCEPTQ